MRLRYIFDTSLQGPPCNFFRAPYVRARWPTCSLPTISLRPRPRSRAPARRSPTGCARATLDEVVGQEHLTGPDGAIGRMVAAGKLSSMILWGPPGTGKTSIARLLADAVGLRFVALSAVFSGVADLKKVFAEARQMAKAGQRTLLFVDEIHRFNRAQQDGFLPFVEDGTITLVGATTENPSFELNAALAQPRAGADPPPPRRGRAVRTARPRRGARRQAAAARPPTPAPRWSPSADGDGRFLLNQAETLLDLKLDRAARPGRARRVAPAPRRGLRQGPRGALQPHLGAPQKPARLRPAGRALLSRADAHRRRGAALRAAPPGPLRQSRTSASPTRRRWSNASPPRTPIDFLGSPEGELAIVQACLYLATAPKSNAAYMAQKAAWRSARKPAR